jgi:hypothetical protein
MTLTANTARIAGLLIGLGAVVVALLAWQVSRPGTPGLDLVVVNTPSVGLKTSPEGPIVNAADMRPRTDSAQATGRLSVLNQRGVAADVRVRALASDSKLNSLLRVKLTAGETTVFAGTLGQLRDYTAQSFRLAPHQRRDLRVRAWLPDSAAAGYQRRIDNVNLQLLYARAAA